MSMFNELNRKWWVLIGVSMASFMGCLDFTIVNTALPSIESALNANVNQLQWVINIFILALSTLMVIMGRLADIYGRRKLLYIGIVVFGLSSLGAGLAANIEWLIFYRFLQGIACAILYTTSGAIVSNTFPENERGKAIGILFGINGIGLAMGPVLGGLLVGLYNWRLVFLVNVPVIIICIIICVFSVRESSNQQGTKIDWLGLIILLIALPCLILGLTQGEMWGWNSLITLGLFSVASVLFVLFYFNEIYTREPIIEFHLFANRVFISSVIATFSLALFYCLAFFLMPLYLHLIRNETSIIIGLMLLPTTAMVAILSPIVGKLVDKYGTKLPLMFGFIFFTISAFMQAHFQADSSLFLILTAFLFMGIGWACILGPSTTASLSAVPEDRGAVAMGSAWTIHNIGGSFGLSVGIAIYSLYANNIMLAELANRHLPIGSWMNGIVTDPDRAPAIIQQFTKLNISDAASIVNEFFISGYHAAMWFLCISSLATLFFLFFGFRKKYQQLSVQV